MKTLTRQEQVRLHALAIIREAKSGRIEIFWHLCGIIRAVFGNQNKCNKSVDKAKVSDKIAVINDEHDEMERTLNEIERLINLL